MHVVRHMKAASRHQHRRVSKAGRHRSRHAASAPPSSPSFLGGFSGGLIDDARSEIGMTAAQLGLPYHLWCAEWLNQLLSRYGYSGTGGRLAQSPRR